MNTLQIQQVEGDCYFKVKVVPASSRTVLAGVLDGMLKLRITAAPEKGKANKDVIAFLAKKLGVKKLSVMITAGACNPVKRVCITDITAENVRKRLKI